APQDRPVPEAKPESRSVWFVALAIATLGVAAVMALIPQTRERGKDVYFAAREGLGLGSPGTYSAVYAHLHMAPLSARLRGSTQSASGLQRLAREPCDKTAIFSLGEGLLAAHEGRVAADAYLAFAAGCPNGDGEQYRAAEIFILLGDNPKAIAIADGLVTR